MTNTIPNVPRELLEDANRSLQELAFAGELHLSCQKGLVISCACTDCMSDRAIDTHSKICTILSAPSPAGVDGLEVVGLSERIRPGVEAAPWVCDEVKKLEAIIDGLRGENEALHAQVKVLHSDANSWQSGYDEGRRMGGKHCALTIDKQAQRVGELEGLLRISSELLTTISAHAGTKPDDWCGTFKREVQDRINRIDAALSAGKEWE